MTEKQKLLGVYLFCSRYKPTVRREYLGKIWVEEIDISSTDAPITIAALVKDMEEMEAYLVLRSVTELTPEEREEYCRVVGAYRSVNRDRPNRLPTDSYSSRMKFIWLSDLKLGKVYPEANDFIRSIGVALPIDRMFDKSYALTRQEAGLKE